MLPDRIIAPAKLSTNTVCHLKPTVDVDGTSLSHLTTLDINNLHATEWLELVIAKQKPADEAIAQTKKIIIQRTKSFYIFDILGTSPEECWSRKDSFMSFPMREPGHSSEGFLTIHDRASGSMVTLAFAHEMQNKTSTLRHCLVNHQEYDEPRAFAKLLLENSATSARSKADLRGGKTLFASSQHMFLMGEMVWLILLSAE